MNPINCEELCCFIHELCLAVVTVGLSTGEMCATCRTILVVTEMLLVSTLVKMHDFMQTVHCRLGSCLNVPNWNFNLRTLSFRPSHHAQCAPDKVQHRL